MNVHCLPGWAALALGAVSLQSLAANGLVTPPAESLWPRWQARITVQSAALAPLKWNGLLDAGGSGRSVQGGAVLGDYYFARPAFGAFRASGGFVSGLLGGLPLAAAGSGPVRGQVLDGSGLRFPDVGGEGPGTLPYLGLGFSGSPWLSGLAISADLGLVAERAGAAGSLRRAVFGNQALDGALREMRVFPLVQLGLSYTF